MPNLKNRFMDQVLRLIRRHLRLEVCAVDQVHWHKEPGDLEFNEVTVVMRDRAKEIDAQKKYTRIRIPVLQNLLGGHCGGYNWNPRKGDLVYCFFYHERKGVCLGNFWGWHEYPNCRPSPYDIADKNGQWMAPYQNPATADFPRQPYPQLKKPYCFRWFHGPVTGTTGPGRDWAMVFDYCRQGDSEPTCKDCKKIDDISHVSNHFLKFYSIETESRKAYPGRGVYHAPGGSYWLFDSYNSPDGTYVSEFYSNGAGFWTAQGAVGEVLKGHIRHSPTGTIDIHSKSEPASIAAEATGTRVVVVSPDDSSVDYAVQAMDYPSTAFKTIMKTGKIHDCSPSEIKLEAPLIILDGDVQINGNNQIAGECVHNACSCAESASELSVDGNEIVVKGPEGNEVYRGTLGTDDTAALNAACSATPDNGTVNIGCCFLNLEASTVFELDPVHTFNTCLLVEGRNLHIHGCGKEATILKLKDNQHTTGQNPVAMILHRKAGQMDPGSKAFSVSDMTIDGNSDNNTGPYEDGCGLILSGSIREGEIYENLILKNSYGHGLYVGNNGSGNAQNIMVRNVIAENCAYSGVMLDTVQESDVSHIIAINCGTDVLSGCGVEILGNSSNYLTRKDNLRVSDITCIGCGLTIFYMNWLHVSNVLVDSRTSTCSRGLSIKDSKNVFIFNGVFTANQAIASSFGGASYISGSQAGATEVNLYQCNFNGYYGLHLVGAALVNAYLCACIGSYACIFEADVDPVTCTVNGYFTSIHPLTGAYGLYLATGSTFNASHCECNPASTNHVLNGTLNDWNTFRIY